jgi:acetoin utilization protein AcuB
MSMLIAADLMTESPTAIGPTESVRKAAELLQTLDVRHLPVINEQRELVGMLSDRDLRALSIPYLIGGEYVGQLRTALDAPVSSLMSGDVLSVMRGADASEVVDLMLDNQIGAVPVTDENGVLVGIVSYVDVLRKLPLEWDAA